MLFSNLNSMDINNNVSNANANINSIKEFGFNNCKLYLGGIWKNLDIKQFEIQKITGGISNHLYLCSIVDGSKAIANEPTQVLMRIYGENHSKNISLINDVVVSLLISDQKLGPKLYGILPNGRIEEFLPSIPLNFMELHDAKISSLVAKALARFHSLEVPFPKQAGWFFDTLTKNLKKLKTLKFETKDEMEKLNKILSYNIEGELQELLSIIEQINSPIVFCHNDFHAGNILKLNDGKLVLIDYEYSNYNFRGFDIGSAFCEWMMNNNAEEYPHFKCYPENFPTKEQQLYFIRSYIETAKQTTSFNNNKDSLNEKKILIEANYFTAVAHLFWSLWSVCQEPNSSFEFSFLDYSLTRMSLYEKQKKKLLEGIL